MSIRPRNIRKGEIVQIHIGLINKKQLPKHPLVRVYVINPIGEKMKLYDSIIPLMPQNDIGNIKERMQNIFCHFTTDTNSLLGCYRIKIDVFNDGILTLSDTVRNDFFFVENLVIRDKHFKNNEICFSIENPSPEDTICIIYYGNKGKYDKTHEMIPSKSTKKYSYVADIVFLKYANTEIIKISPNTVHALRNPRFFWRDEDEKTVFVLDPTAEKKRSFFLTGTPSKIWKNATGLESLANLRTKTVFQEMADKGLIIEI
jgi:hypothetical protein